MACCDVDLAWTTQEKEDRNHPANSCACTSTSRSTSANASDMSPAEVQSHRVSWTIGAGLDCAGLGQQASVDYHNSSDCKHRYRRRMSELRYVFVPTDTPDIWRRLISTSLMTTRPQTAPAVRLPAMVVPNSANRHRSTLKMFGKRRNTGRTSDARSQSTCTGC